MHPINIILKWFFNFSFWMLTFLVIGVLLPSIVAGYSSKAVFDHIDLKELGAAKIFIAQVFACVILICVTWLIMQVAEVHKQKRLQKRSANPNTENTQNVQVNNNPESEKETVEIPAIPSFITDELFSAFLNFSNVCLAIGIFIDRSFFLLGFFCFGGAFFVGFYMIKKNRNKF